MKAGTRLGGADGAARVLALFIDGLAYSCSQMTDGFVPAGVVTSSALTHDPVAVAQALVAVRLWHRAPGGYQIHDFHDWNKTASEVKKIRRKWREKKRRQRRGGNGRFTAEHRASEQFTPRRARVQAGPLSPQDRDRDSRARDPRSTIHDPCTSTNKPRSTDPGTSDRQCTNRRSRAGTLTFTTKKPPTHRVLCAMVRAEIADTTTNTTYADRIEGVKLRLARQGFSYPTGEQLTDAFDAIDCADRRRRGTA